MGEKLNIRIIIKVLNAQFGKTVTIRYSPRYCDCGHPHKSGTSLNDLQ